MADAAVASPAERARGGAGLARLRQATYVTGASDVVDGGLSLIAAEHQWRYSGSATGSSITASAPGAYSCAVEATNEAGSSVQASAPHAVAVPPADLRRR